MIHLLTPFISRLLALLFSAVIGFFIGAGTTPVTGFVVFSVVLLWFFSGLVTKDLPYSIPFLRNLKCFEGTARGIRHSTDTQGTDSSITTYQVASFTLDGIPVQLTMRESIFIDEGDELVVSGLYRRGLLTGLAYKNRSRNNVVQRAPAGGYIFFSLLFGFFGLFALTTPEDLTGVGWVLSIISIGLFRTGTSIYRAANDVRQL